jgi:ketosteroid isomerase-like protein
MRHLALLASLAIATAACQESTGLGDSAMPPASARAHPLDLREQRAALTAAGNAVSAAIVSDGIVAGLGGALAEDGLLLSPRTNTLVGRAAATEFLATVPIAPSAMSWEVIAAEVSNDGTQGYTWAQGSVTIDFGAGAQTVPNFFLIYWRRGASDVWEIAAFVFNRGGPETLPLPDGFGTPDNKHRRNFPNTDVAEQRQAVLSADAAFSAYSVDNGSGPAFERFAAPNAIAVGGGQFVLGPAALGEAFAGGPNDVVSWVPRFADVAASGDLGFSVGDATFDLPDDGVLFYSKYLTVWQKQNTGEWRYVADLGNNRPGP